MGLAAKGIQTKLDYARNLKPRFIWHLTSDIMM